MLADLYGPSLEWLPSSARAEVRHFLVRLAWNIARPPGLAPPRFSSQLSSQLSGAPSPSASASRFRPRSAQGFGHAHHGAVHGRAQRVASGRGRFGLFGGRSAMNQRVQR